MSKRNSISLDKKVKYSVFGIISFILIGIYALSLIITLVWVIYTSLMGSVDFRIMQVKANASPQFFGSMEKNGIVFENWLKVFSEFYVNRPNGQAAAKFSEMALYSVLWAVGAAVVAEVSRCMCAYVVAKFGHHKWTKLVHSLVIILIIISFPSNLAVSIKFNKMVLMYDNLFMRIIGSVTFTGTHFLFYYASFKSLSWGYAEAAYMDGANDFTVMIKIMMPLIKTTLFALILLEFITHWNEYSTSMIYMPSYPTLAYGLFKFVNGSRAINVPITLASCTIVVIPIVLLFILFHNKLMGNLALGGLKG